MRRERDSLNRRAKYPTRYAALICVALTLLLGTSGLAAQTVTSPHHGRILGVFDDDSGAPIPNAEVIDLFVGSVGHTESHGLAELSHFHNQNDSAAVRIRKIGYSDTSLIVMVGPSDTVPVQVNLRRAAVDLPALIAHAKEVTAPASPMLAEFEERRKEGFGHYIDGAELRKYVDDHSFVNYLASHFAGVSLLMRRSPSDPAYLSTKRTGGPCPVSLYVDGVLVYSPGGGQPIPDLSNYNSTEYAAVEFYSAASAPVQFNATGSSCGVLLLWRRYR
ncbi:MAG TPA: hypothetical protein VGM67_19415 [Gemmatimonadaceae bacterium]|jgi:hypothetical protein